MAIPMTAIHVVKDMKASFRLGAEIPETNICLVVHVMFILVFVFCESFYKYPDYINTNQQSTGNYIQQYTNVLP